VSFGPCSLPFDFRAHRLSLIVIHRHGTELDPEFSYCSGNEEPHMGFGHLGFVVDDVPGLVKRVEEAGELHWDGSSGSADLLPRLNRLQGRQASRCLHCRDYWLADWHSFAHQGLPRALLQHGHGSGEPADLLSAPFAANSLAIAGSRWLLVRARAERHGQALENCARCNIEHILRRYAVVRPPRRPTPLAMLFAEIRSLAQRLAQQVRKRIGRLVLASAHSETTCRGNLTSLEMVSEVKGPDGQRQLGADPSAPTLNAEPIEPASLPQQKLVGYRKEVEALSTTAFGPAAVSNLSA